MMTVTILTKNSALYLNEVLEALKNFDEVVIYDTGSVDETMAIAKRFQNVSLYEGPFEGFGKTHNQASSLAKHEWILSIDSDEIMTSELAKEIAGLQLDARNVYSVPRKNYIGTEWIWHSGWSPDRVVRLYNRKVTHFSCRAVHEKVVDDHLQEVELESPLLHYPYRKTSDFLKKMHFYAELFAKENVGKRNSSQVKAFFHALFAFFKTYVLKLGIFGGRWGFYIALYNANTAFYKYALLNELNEENGK